MTIIPVFVMILIAHVSLSGSVKLIRCTLNQTDNCIVTLEFDNDGDYECGNFASKGYFTTGIRIWCRMTDILKSYFDIAGKKFRKVELIDVGLEKFSYENLDTPDAEMFDASVNQLTEIPFCTFCITQQISVVNFSHNVITTISARAFELTENTPSKIKSLDVSNNKIATISDNTFGNLFLLQELNLAYNLIESLLKDLFFHTTNLKSLDLGNNKLLNTEFDCPNSLRTLNLTNNNLSMFRMSSLSNLQQLDISFNHINAVDNTTFTNLSALQVLNMQNNLIEIVERGVFSNNHKLQSLRLENNKIKEFHSEFYGGIVIDLSNNLLIGFNATCGYDYIKIDLNIENNRLPTLMICGCYSKLRAANNQLDWMSTDYKKTAVEVFNMSHNQIQNVREIIDQMGEPLKVLDVSNNFLGRVNVTTFTKLINLVELILRNTSLSNIQYATFHHQQKLRVLDISYNNLKKISIYWKSLNNIEMVYLDGNNLTEISGFNRNILEKVSTVGLSRNNFSCDYLIGFLAQFTDVKFIHDDAADHDHIERIACDTVRHANDLIETATIKASTSQEKELHQHHEQMASYDRELIFLEFIFSFACAIYILQLIVRALWSRRCCSHQNEPS